MRYAEHGQPLAFPLHTNRALMRHRPAICKKAHLHGRQAAEIVSFSSELLFILIILRTSPPYEKSMKNLRRGVPLPSQGGGAVNMVSANCKENRKKSDGWKDVPWM